MTYEYIDLEDLIGLGEALIEDFTVRDLGLLGAAAERPRTSAFGQDAYPDLWTKAAALLQSLVNSHPLVDGNKRLGWLATAVFLDLNGGDPTLATNDQVYELILSVASGNPDIEKIAKELSDICSS